MRRTLIALAGLAVVIQLVPYGRDHTNPAVIEEPVWDSAQTRELAVAACFDCHSNETVWPWYTNIAPISWLTVHDVDEGRQKLNFSDWGRRQEADEAAETVREGSMPPWYYAAIHPNARLSQEDIRALETGLTATIGGR
jgi:mono/diheme cytochrome c family protein